MCGGLPTDSCSLQSVPGNDYDCVKTNATDGRSGGRIWYAARLILAPPAMETAPDTRAISATARHGSAMKTRHTLLSIALVVAVVTAAFYPALQNGFTNWDDDKLLTQNRVVKDLRLGSMMNPFSGHVVGTYIPLTLLSFALEFQCFGLDPFYYHLDNLLLHVANALLFFLLAEKLCGSQAAALVGALIWAVHPMRVESVAWVTERKDVLFALFYLGSVMAYSYYRQGGKAAAYLSCLALFVLSCLSKGVAVTLPLSLLLCDYWEDGRLTLKSITEKWPFFSISLVFSVIAINAQNRGLAGMQHAHLGWLERLVIPCYNVLFYLGKLIWPLPLSALYPYPCREAGRLPSAFLAAPVALALLVTFCLLFFRKNRGVLAAGLFFLIAILPTLQVKPLLGVAMAADRYTYLPSMGLFLLVGAGLNSVWSNQRIDKRVRHFAAVVPVVMVLTGVVLTRQQCTIWSDSVRLWSDVIDKHPAALAYNNRGVAWKDLGNDRQAESDFDKAIELEPGYALAYGNRGEVRMKNGRLDQALEDYRKETGINTSSTRGHNNLGFILMNTGRYREALESFNMALGLDPRFAEAYYNRALIYGLLDDRRTMMEDLHLAIECDPENGGAYAERGREYLSRLEPQKALADFDKAIALGVATAQTFLGRGRAHGMLEMLDEAISDLERSATLDPDNGEIRMYLAKAYYASGATGKARENLAMAEALGVEPDAVMRKLLSQSLEAAP